MKIDNRDIVTMREKYPAFKIIEHEKEYIFTGEFDLDHIKDAYDEAVNNKTDLVKAVIKIK